MKVRKAALATSVVVLSALAGGAEAAAPPAAKPVTPPANQPARTPPPSISDPVKPPRPPIVVKKAPTLAMASMKAVFGENKVFEAILTYDGKPLAGKVVGFAVGDDSHRIHVDATTDSHGRASSPPRSLAMGPGTYPISVRFSGNDPDFAEATGSANLVLSKANTKVSIDCDFSHKIVNYDTAHIGVTAIPSGIAAPSTWTITMMGATASQHKDTSWLPLENASSWNIRVQYPGNWVTNPSEARATCVKPSF